MNTPAIGNLDSDEYLEVVIPGYAPSSDIIIINHDGTGNTIEFNEKVSGGVSLADFNNDSIDEIMDHHILNIFKKDSFDWFNIGW